MFGCIKLENDSTDKDKFFFVWLVLLARWNSKKENFGEPKKKTGKLEKIVLDGERLDGFG